MTTETESVEIWIERYKLRMLRKVFDLANEAGDGEFFESIGLPAGATWREFQRRYLYQGGVQFDLLVQDVSRHEPTRRLWRDYLDSYGVTPEKLLSALIDDRKLFEKAGRSDLAKETDEMIREALASGRVKRH